MPWVLKQNGHPASRNFGRYVQTPGSVKTYGPLKTAQRFATEKDARLAACQNETPVYVER